jgi:hypothetical protein
MTEFHLRRSHEYMIDCLDDLDAVLTVPRPGSSRKPPAFCASYIDGATGLLIHVSQLTILMKTTFAQGKNEMVEQIQTPSKEKDDTESTVSSQC